MAKTANRVTPAEIAALWQNAYERVAATDKTVQALFRGVNIRINLAKALEAAAATAKAFLEGAKAYAGDLSGTDWIGLGAEAIHAITATFGALVEAMLPLDYVACMLLSGHPQGITQQDLQKEIEAFLKNPKAKRLPWYLGVSKSRVGNAADAARTKDWFPQLLERLRKDDWLIESGDRLQFRSRNFQLGLKFD